MGLSSFLGILHEIRLKRRERDLNPRDLHRSQAFETQLVPGLRPTRLGDPGLESTQFFLYIKVLIKSHNIMNLRTLFLETNLHLGVFQTSYRTH